MKDMRKRLLYLLFMILVIRLGSQLPVPGVDKDFFKEFFASTSNDAFNFFDAFTGGSFTSMSILALNITPYITASIIIQLLTIAIPALEEMQRDIEAVSAKEISDLAADYFNPDRLSYLIFK
jgi:preprotein translocase subunit SecY